MTEQEMFEECGGKNKLNIKKQYILSIDPSNKASAFCLIEVDTLNPIEFNFSEEDDMLNYIENISTLYNNDNSEISLVVEGMQSFGMAVGASVLNTCVLIGRILERAKMTHRYKDIHILYRKEEKLNLCGTNKAKDANIIQALIDRFAPDTENKGKGSKKNQGFFYGFRADIWQAFAVGVTYYDIYFKNCEHKRDKEHEVL